MNSFILILEMLDVVRQTRTVNGSNRRGIFEGVISLMSKWTRTCART